jgi:hypothetical protein
MGRGRAIDRLGEVANAAVGEVITDGGAESEVDGVGSDAVGQGDQVNAFGRCEDPAEVVAGG